MLEPARSPSSAAAAWTPRNLVCGKLAASRRAIVGGLRRAGGGKRVNTEKVSNAACPARPSRRLRRAANVVSCCSWSATAKATATLVSTSSSGALLLPGIAQRAHEAVVDLGASCWDDEQPAPLVERLLACERLDPQTRSLCSDLDLARPKTELVTELLRDYQSPCLVNGCPHAFSLPRTWHERIGLSLGDRACLALARRLGAAAYTADSTWSAA